MSDDKNVFRDVLRKMATEDLPFFKRMAKDPKFTAEQRAEIEAMIADIEANAPKKS